MKVPFLVLALISFTSPNNNFVQKWENFKLHHKKFYESSEEETYRFHIFLDNLKTIDAHNFRHSIGEVSYTKGVNKFADLTSEEFLTYVNRFKYIKNHDNGLVETFVSNPNDSLPDWVDWRTKGCLSEVKDQGKCGSCWTFSTTGCLEAHFFLKHNRSILLSEQNLIDCSRNFWNRGCQGGLMEFAFEYIKENGLESEGDYQYLGTDGTCQFNESKSVVSVSGYVKVNRSEVDLQAALATIGPISVTMDSTEELQHYEKGILIDDSCNKFIPNHCVLLVGYGTEDDKDFYIIKNSWGKDWGEEGYFRLGKRGFNPCGIMGDGSYPIVV